MTRRYSFVDVDEARLIRRLHEAGRSQTAIAILTGRSTRTIRDILSKPDPDDPTLRPCPTCGILLAPGEVCDCEAARETDREIEAWLDDSGFWGPTLPPRERAAREGPPLCEVLLGG